jgi:hypothetical protein
VDNDPSISPTGVSSVIGRTLEKGNSYIFTSKVTGDAFICMAQTGYDKYQINYYALEYKTSTIWINIGNYYVEDVSELVGALL